MMADFNCVPVLDVSTDNSREAWPAILLAIQSSTFTAIDMEMSGLGNRRKLNPKSMDERYDVISDIAKSRSVLSMGVSCFKLVPENDNEESNDSTKRSQTELKTVKMTDMTFQVQTFNIFLLCCEEYVVDPSSLKFLVEHGFDFNKQYSKGIPYWRGSDKKMKEVSDKNELLIRELLNTLISCETPVVFHNAVVDLIFLYHSFYASLPSKMSTFLADMTEMFSGGIYDTKYIVEFKARFPASYLEYAFRRCQRDNRKSVGQGSCRICLLYLKYPEGVKHLTYLPCGLAESTPYDSSKLCFQFANHGWCPHGASCLQSHDVDKILDSEPPPPSKRRRKRKKEAHGNENSAAKGATIIETENAASDSSVNANKQEGTSDAVNSSLEIVDEFSGTETRKNGSTVAIHASRTEGHRAGFDAFMTGFVFAHFIAKHGKVKDLPPDIHLNHLGMQEFRNKIALTGKDIPLHVAKSNFARMSKEHSEKILLLRGT